MSRGVTSSRPTMPMIPHIGLAVPYPPASTRSRKWATRAHLSRKMTPNSSSDGSMRFKTAKSRRATQARDGGTPMNALIALALLLAAPQAPAAAPDPDQVQVDRAADLIQNG